MELGDEERELDGFRFGFHDYFDKSVIYRALRTNNDQDYSLMIRRENISKQGEGEGKGGINDDVNTNDKQPTDKELSRLVSNSYLLQLLHPRLTSVTVQLRQMGQIYVSP